MKNSQTILFSLLAYICFLVPSQVWAENKPNVLMLIVDDLNDWVGVLGGHPQVKTPNIDRLAARGTTFLNAHCNSPLCNPSRTSFMTGLRPSTTGVYGLAPWFREAEPLKNLVTLPQYFSSAGYTSYTGGKVYHGKYKAKQGSTEFDVVGKVERHLGNKTKRVQTVYGGKGMDWGLYEHKDSDARDWKVADWAVEALGSMESKPFFMTVGFSLPHVPLFTTQKWLDMYPENEVVLPVMKDDDRDDTPRFSWYLHWKLPEPRRKFLIDNDEERKIVQAYLASVSFMDHQVGRVLDALEKNELADNTIIIFLSDHGYHLGEKEITGKNTLWEESTRIPLIISGPGMPKGGRCEEPAELIDVYPTLVEAARLNEKKGLDGISLMPQIKNPSKQRLRPAITTHNHDNHSVCTKEWRFIQYADGSKELYHKQKDPHEFKNLVSDPEYANIIKKLSKWLPKKNTKPVPGSANRILIYQDGSITWEGEPISEHEPIPEF